MKRSASGEAAAAAAKKQKTTPLAAYQQAQEHLKAQALQVCFVDMHAPQGRRIDHGAMILTTETCFALLSIFFWQPANHSPCAVL